MDNLRLNAQSHHSIPPSATLFDPSQSLLRLQELQRQQEQLLLQQQQIKEQMRAVAQTLPQLVPATGSSPARAPQSHQQHPSTPPPVVSLQTTLAAVGAQRSPSQQLAPSGDAGQQPMDQQTASALQVNSAVPSHMMPSANPAIYSHAVINAAAETLMRGNSQAYLQMLMSYQGKAQTGEANAGNQTNFQQQIHAAVRAQHGQLQQYQQSRQKLMMQRNRTLASQMQALSQGKNLAAGGPTMPQRPASGEEKNKGSPNGAKRASAA